MSHKILRRIVLFFVSFFLFSSSSVVYCQSKLIISKSKDIIRQIKKENTIYIIKYVYDLKGNTLIVPINCQLDFQGGKIINGSVIGNGTGISAGRERIFEKVTLNGSWSNSKVFSEWLDFNDGLKVDNSHNFKNLMLLCQGESFTHLYMQKGVFYCSVLKGSSNIKVPSNVYWHNSATIQQLPTDLPKYSLVLIKQASNVTIDGGEFVGDVQTHYGSEGEWGHGIKVSGGTNVVLKNLACREFWGDGIDLIEGEYVNAISAGVGICENILIDSVRCLYNRRQGLSIEAAKKVLVRNSEFAYTGKYKKTAPGAGIDIEPWCTNELKIDNIRIYNSKIHNNQSSPDLCLYPNLVSVIRKTSQGNSAVNRISIEKCHIGKMSLFGANSVNIEDCEIEAISQYKYGKNIRMNNCSIKRKSDIKSRDGLTMKRCK